MKSSGEESEIKKAERLFRVLLRIYPRSFRTEYQQEMEQLFRDQLRDAVRGGKAGLLLFFLKTGVDVCGAALREQVTEFGGNMHRIRKNWFGFSTASYGRAFGLVLVLLVALHVTGVTLLLPKTYRSSARIDLQERIQRAAYDPFSIQTEFERIFSPRVLERVIAEQSLDKAWPDRGEETTGDTAIARLRKMITLRQSRNTSLIEVSVFDQNSGRAAAIANSLIGSYRRELAERGIEKKAFVVEAAVPSPRAIRPNLPIWLITGFLALLPVSALVALILQTGKRTEASSLA